MAELLPQGGGPGTPFSADRAFQNQWRDAAPKRDNGYSNLAAIQPRPQGHCITCNRPVPQEAPGSFCRDCYRTAQFFGGNNVTGAQPKAVHSYVTPKIEPNEGLVDNDSHRRD